jgi:hypothetical protein
MEYSLRDLILEINDSYGHSISKKEKKQETFLILKMKTHFENKNTF